jgi:hypothetical protein
MSNRANTLPPESTREERILEYMRWDNCDREEAERRVAAAEQRGKTIIVDGQPLTFGAPD